MILKFFLHVTHYRNDRRSRGGGVLVAVNDSIPSLFISSPADLEVIVVQIYFTNPLNLCTVYVPPNSGVLYFNSLLSFLSDMLSSDVPCIIVGDFNLPNICWLTLTGDSPLSTSFCEFIFDWNLTQHILDPTHILYMSSRNATRMIIVMMIKMVMMLVMIVRTDIKTRKQ